MEKATMANEELPRVEILSKPDCHLCEEAKALLRQLQATCRFTLHEVDITTRDELYQRYAEEIPVVFIDGHKAFKYRINPHQFVRRIQRAHTCRSQERQK